MHIQMRGKFLVVRQFSDEYTVWRLKSSDEGWEELRDCCHFKTEDEVQDHIKQESLVHK
jgi:hypothetical protein